jgi:hypothetical protein
VLPAGGPSFGDRCGKAVQELVHHHIGELLWHDVAAGVVPGMAEATAMCAAGALDGSDMQEPVVQGPMTNLQFSADFIVAT